MQIKIKTRMGKHVLEFNAEVSDLQMQSLCGVPLANALKPLIAKAAKHSDDWDLVSEADVRTHFPVTLSRKGEGDYALELLSVAAWTPAAPAKTLTPAEALEIALAAVKSGTLVLAPEQAKALAAMTSAQSAALDAM